MHTKDILNSELTTKYITLHKKYIDASNQHTYKNVEIIEATSTLRIYVQRVAVPRIVIVMIAR